MGYLKLDTHAVEKLIIEGMKDMEIYSTTTVCIGVIEDVEVHLTLTRDEDDKIFNTDDNDGNDDSLCISLEEEPEP